MKLLFGYTHEEAKANFPESLAALGEKLGLDAEMRNLSDRKVEQL